MSRVFIYPRMLFQMFCGHAAGETALREALMMRVVIIVMGAITVLFIALIHRSN